MPGRHALLAIAILPLLLPSCSTLFLRPSIRLFRRTTPRSTAKINFLRPYNYRNVRSIIWESYPPLNSTDEVKNAVKSGGYNHTGSDDKDDKLNMRAVKLSVAAFLNEPLVEVLDCVLVLASSLFVAVSTINTLPSVVVSVLTIAQDIVAGVFVLEFFARWFCSSAPRGLHFTQPLILVDVFVVLLPFLVTTTGTEWLPAWLTSSSSLINLRLLRVLRLQRVLQNMKTFTRFERALGIPVGNVKAWQLQLARVLLSVFTLLSVATGLIYTVEHTVNPLITDYFTALYFGLTTLTTVGFGDITPVTWQGKLVVSLSIMAGVTVIPAQGAALIDALLERQRDKELREAQATGSIEPKLKPNLSAISRRRLGYNQPVIAPATERITLEMSVSCTTCGASMHWSNARYCWQCGRELELDNSVSNYDDELDDKASSIST